MFAHQHANVLPDILTMAKPLGGGLPLGAILLREELASVMHVGDHGSTFGGNPVACAAAEAVLDRLMSDGFLDSVADRSEVLRKGLKKLAKKHEQIQELRGLGLMCGVLFEGPAGPVVKALRERRILATKAGDNVLRLLPPLVIGRKDVKELLTVLGEILQTGAGKALSL